MNYPNMDPEALWSCFRWMDRLWPPPPPPPPPPPHDYYFYRDRHRYEPYDYPQRHRYSPPPRSYNDYPRYYKRPGYDNRSHKHQWRQPLQSNRKTNINPDKKPLDRSVATAGSFTREAQREAELNSRSVSLHNVKKHQQQQQCNNDADSSPVNGSDIDIAKLPAAAAAAADNTNNDDDSDEADDIDFANINVRPIID